LSLRKSKDSSISHRNRRAAASYNGNWTTAAKRMVVACVGAWDGMGRRANACFSWGKIAINGRIVIYYIMLYLLDL
jgi:hypothetical protein